MPCWVLVVEDDDILRWMMAEAVDYLGHPVIECRNAVDALQQLHGEHPFGLVITDVRMPGRIDGLGLAKAVWSTHPMLPVIIISAYTILPLKYLPANARFITKPCTLDLLSRTMEDLLAPIHIPFSS